MNTLLDQQIGDLEAKIAEAANQSGGGADEESRIDDMCCQLSTLEQKRDKETAPGRIFELIEPHLKKDPGFKPARYKTTWGNKTKKGLLACFQRIIDEHE